MKVLIADDEKNIRELLKDFLEERSYEVETAENGEVAMQKLKAGEFDILISDMKMPYRSGIEILREISGWESFPVTIMITAYSSVETAVECIKLGAHDFILKPIDPDEILKIIEKATAVASQNRNQPSFKKQKTKAGKTTEIVGEHESIKLLKNMIDKVAVQDVTVLIQGESGTGKELVARLIHEKSKRSSGPFIAVNCAALNDNLIESEFFGHEKGAFTGASEKRIGRFELAENGTIFLDEIGDLPHAVQAKLLRVLQEKTFERVGGTSQIKTNVRVITATCQELKKKIQNNEFREDLYFRLNVFPIVTPPLRNRISDLPLLIDFLLKKYCSSMEIPAPKISQDFIEACSKNSWRGNIRELENIIQRLLILHSDKSVWTQNEFPSDLHDDSVSEAKPAEENSEEGKIRSALVKAAGNISLAAEKLEISRVTLYAKIKQFGINLKELKAGI